eukprot:10019304-Alexandrium_andersonii.AAC.1
MFDEQLSDPCQLGTLRKRSQRKAALVLQPVTRGLGIVSGLFCCVQQLHHGSTAKALIDV